MMRILALAALLGGLLSVAACAARTGPNGEISAGGASADAGGGVSSSSAMPTPSGLPPAMSPNQVQPDNRAIDLKPVRWTGATADGRQLTISYTATGSPACSVLGRIDLVETAQSVTVTVLLGRLPTADCTGVQIQLAAPMSTVVTLHDPAGTRPVRDGAAA